MAPSKSDLNVVVAPRAVTELDEIWLWNVRQYGVDHADKYLVMLQTAVFGLGKSFAEGRAIPGVRDLRFQLIRRKSRGHGHVVVYQVRESEVIVVHVFHTAQDWLSKLKSEHPHS